MGEERVEGLDLEGEQNPVSSCLGRDSLLPPGGPRFHPTKSKATHAREPSKPNDASLPLLPALLLLPLRLNRLLLLAPLARPSSSTPMREPHVPVVLQRVNLGAQFPLRCSSRCVARRRQREREGRSTLASERSGRRRVLRRRRWGTPGASSGRGRGGGGCDGGRTSSLDGGGAAVAAGLAEERRTLHGWRAGYRGLLGRWWEREGGEGGKI